MKFKSTFDTVSAIFGAVALVVATIEAENDAPGAGAAKKAEAVAKLTPLLNSIVPDAWEPVLAVFLPVLVDLVVKAANQTSFFD